MPPKTPSLCSFPCSVMTLNLYQPSQHLVLWTLLSLGYLPLLLSPGSTQKLLASFSTVSYPSIMFTELRLPLVLPTLSPHVLSPALYSASSPTPFHPGASHASKRHPLQYNDQAKSWNQPLPQRCSTPLTTCPPHITVQSNHFHCSDCCLDLPPLDDCSGLHSADSAS